MTSHSVEEEEHAAPPKARSPGCLFLLSSLSFRMQLLKAGNGKTEDWMKAFLGDDFYLHFQATVGPNESAAAEENCDVLTGWARRNQAKGSQNLLAHLFFSAYKQYIPPVFGNYIIATPLCFLRETRNLLTTLCADGPLCHPLLALSLQHPPYSRSSMSGREAGWPILSEFERPSTNITASAVDSSWLDFPFLPATLASSPSEDAAEEEYLRREKGSSCGVGPKQSGNEPPVPPTSPNCGTKSNAN